MLFQKLAFIFYALTIKNVSPGVLHHMMTRGIECNDILKDNKDRDNFIERLGSIVKETSTSCYAWALLSNHVYLLLRIGGTDSISKVMRRLLPKLYATFFSLSNVWVSCHSHKFYRIIDFPNQNFELHVSAVYLSPKEEIL